MTMSQEACHRLLHLRKKPSDDKEPPSSSSFSTLEKKTKRWQWASWFVLIFYIWGKKQ
jgi:hypothetical protein